MRALITGITGQDGSYLAEFLLGKGYEVAGVVRRSSMEKFDRIEGIRDRIRILQADIHDQTSMLDAVRGFEPTELYHLAAQSFVPTSWSQPVLTGEYTGLAVTRVLEAIRQIEHLPNRPPADFRMPGQAFSFVAELVVIDHRTGTVQLVASVLNDLGEAPETLWADAQARLDRLQAALAQPSEAYLAEIDLTNATMRGTGLERPRIAVAALNPHAGDGGNFGREEIDVIEPAVRAAAARGLAVDGPWPADTVFLRAQRGDCDAGREASGRGQSAAP